MEGQTAARVCVTGAAGFIGSWLVMRLLQRGYTVKATVRDPANLNKVKHLLELPKADENLTLWKADLMEEGSFDEAVRGCSGVFHVATPKDFESQDPENEVIKPTVDGALSILKSCANAKTVERLVFVSSGGTVAMQERKLVQYDETCWSDVDFIRAKKMTGWMYFASKTLAEKAAWGAAQENDIDFISVIPTLVVGPFIIPSMPPSLITALSLITRNEGHYSIIKQCQYVHLDDLCNALVFLFRGVEEHLEVISFSSKTLTDLGFQFKYGFENMYTGAIETCIEKGLIPRCLNDNDHAAVGKIHNIMVLDVGFTSVAINLLPVCLKEA
ncbi:hypothetical protein SCA6_012783 [Theobroma cacao]